MASPLAKALICSLLRISCMDRRPRHRRNHLISAVKHQILNTPPIGFSITGKEESSSGNQSELRCGIRCLIKPSGE